MKKLILMIGSIGSGKTTFAKQLKPSEDCVRISQDEMGRKAYLINFYDAIEAGVNSIIVDRMNFNVSQSRSWGATTLSKQT